MDNLKKQIDRILEYINKFGNLLYKYRYYIAIVLFIIFVLFEISGSSIGNWKKFGMSDIEDEGVIFGKSREIRSDEWAVLTPMTFSQKFDGFKYFSDIIRGTKTDVFMVYGLPTFNLMQIFRPFQLGFLFLGLSRGLSFFWMGRLIALFLVMFELSMIITKKNKLLSFIGATLVTLAPVVQWWFAVNGIAEIFIFGGLALILLDKYMKADELKKRCLYLIGMVISAGGYIMVLYPAWQVSMFYVFLALAIWIIIENIKNFKINYKDIISIVIAIIILCICMGYILSQSIETIKTVTNTVYPGARSETGGNLRLYTYIDYITNIFTPAKEEGLVNTNTCEKAYMFSLFPIGIIIAITTMFKEKKKDALLISLFVAYAFLSIYCLIGFPKILAKITLMKNVTANRCFLALGFLDVLILLRSLTIIEKPIKRIPSILVAVTLPCVMAFWSKLNNGQYITMKMAIDMVIMCTYLFYFIFRYKAKYSNYLFTCGIVFVMIMCGATVNPIRKGVDVVYESSTMKAIQKINNNENGKWIVEGVGFPIPNFLLMAGAPVINSTNTYPDLEKWYLLDENKEYEKIYNRYAHITMALSNEEKIEDKFELIGTDQFKVNISTKDIKTLDVKYIFTNNDLEEYSDNNCQFEEIENINGYHIYKTVY